MQKWDPPYYYGLAFLLYKIRKSSYDWNGSTNHDVDDDVIVFGINSLLRVHGRALFPRLLANLHLFSKGYSYLEVVIPRKSTYFQLEPFRSC